MTRVSFPPVCGTDTSTGSGGGYFFDPMPLEEWSTHHTTGNLFIARKADGTIGDKSIAEALRDQMMDSEMEPYNENPLRMIMLQYIDAHTGVLTNLQQSRIYVAAHDGIGAGYHWVDTFGHEGASINLAAHSIHELKDGNQTLHDIDVLETDMHTVKTDIDRNADNIRLMDVELTKIENAIPESDILIDPITKKFELDCEKVKEHFISTNDTINISTTIKDSKCVIDLESTPLQLETTEGTKTDINTLKADENITIVNMDGVAKIKSFAKLTGLDANDSVLGKFDKIKAGTNVTLQNSNGKCTISVPNVMMSDDYAFKGFFNSVEDLHKVTTGITPNESYAYVLSAEGASATGTAPRTIPVLYIYQEGEGTGTKPTWYPQHVKGALVCDYGTTKDKIIESIRFKGDTSKVTEDPSRFLNVELPFTMDSNFVGVFADFNEMTHELQTYKGKFFYKRTVGLIRTTNKPNDPRWDIIRWYKADIAQPTVEQIRDESNWKRDTIGSKNGIGGQIAGDTSIKPITKIVLAENVGEFQDNNKTLKISGIEGSVGGNHKNIKSIAVIPNSTGTSSLDASTGALNLHIPKHNEVTAQVGSGATQPITNISASNRFSVIEDGTLKLPVISALAKDGTLVDEIKNIKAGDNIEFTNVDGVVTITSTATDGVAKLNESNVFTMPQKIGSDPAKQLTFTAARRTSFDPTDSASPDVMPFTAGDTLLRDYVDEHGNAAHQVYTAMVEADASSWELTYDSSLSVTALDSAINLVDGRVDTLSSKLDMEIEDLDRLGITVGDIDRSITGIEGDISLLGTKVELLEPRVIANENKIAALETHFKPSGLVHTLNQSHTNLSTEFNQEKEKVAQLEVDKINIQGKVSKNINDIKDLKDRLDAIRIWSLTF